MPCRLKSAQFDCGLPGCSLDVNEEIALKDIFAFFISLRAFISSIVFPSQGSGALDTVNVSNGVVTSRHLAVIGFSLDHIDDPVE